MVLSLKKELFFAFLLITVSSAKAMHDQEMPDAPSMANQQVRPVRRKLDFTNLQDIPQQPAPKKARVEVSPIQPIPADDEVLTPATIFFHTPDLIARMAPFLPLSDFFRLARVSKACNEATKMDFLLEQGIAKHLIAHETSPIITLLTATEKAQKSQKETVTFYGKESKQQSLADALRIEGASLLVELNNSDEQLTGEFDGNVPAIYCSVKPNIPFTNDELSVLKPIKYIAVASAEETEDQLVDRVKTTCALNPFHMIELDLHPSEDVVYVGEITDSMINRLAQHPIVSLHCEEQSFPQGLACLGALHQLRELSILDGDIPDGTIPDELCKGLPLLTRLEIDHSQIRIVSPLIGNLQYLTTLSLANNPLTSLPQSFRNLHQLKTIRFWKLHPTLPATTLINALPSLSNTKLLSIAYTGSESPFPAGCNLETLETLLLKNDNPTLPTAITRCINLKKLSLLNRTITQLPAWLTTLPKLEELNGNIANNTIIKCEVLTFIAHKLTRCSLFTTNDNDINEIKTIATLWLCIQNNINLIRDRLAKLDKETETQCQPEIAMLNNLSARTITTSYLRTCIADTASVENCLWFLQYILLANDLASSGITEIQRACKDIKQKGNFKATLNKINAIVCSDKAIYHFPIPGMNSGYTNMPLLSSLSKIVLSMNQTLVLITHGAVITGAQFNKCVAALPHTLSKPEKIKTCTTALANLFFCHAIERKDTTNAEIMLRKGANINYFIPGTGRETALHIVVAKRLKETDLKLQAELDHVICFLVKHKASLDQKNSAGQTAMDLIPEDHTLREQITKWAGK